MEGGQAGESPAPPLSGGRHQLAVTDASRDDAPAGVAGAQAVVAVTSGQSWILLTRSDLIDLVKLSRQLLA